MKRGASLKRKQVGKQEEIHFNDDDELDSNDEEEEGVPTSAIKEVKDDEEAPGIYVVRWPTPTAKVDLRYAQNKADVLAQLEDEYGDTFGCQIYFYDGPISISFTPRLPLRWKSSEFIKVTESNMVSSFRSLLECKDFSDYTLLIETPDSPDPIELPVHKVVLASRSSFLRDLLLKDPQSKSYKITGYSVATVRAFVDYLYSDECPTFGVDFFQLLKLAHLCNIERLKQLCEKNIDENFENYDKDHIFQTLELADTFNAKQLREVTIFMVASSIKNCKLNPPKHDEQKKEQEEFLGLFEEFRKTNKALAEEIESLLYDKVAEDEQPTKKVKASETEEVAKTERTINPKLLEHTEIHFDERLLETTLLPSLVGVKFDIAPEGNFGTDMILDLQQFVLPELTKTLDSFTTGKKVAKNKKPPMIEDALRKDMQIVFTARAEMEKKGHEGHDHGEDEVENAMNELF